jgi:hypothetical protein
MKRIFIFLIFLVYTTLLTGQDQPKNIFGISGGISPAILDYYFDDPYDFWVNGELSPIGQVFYARQVRESFRIGGYLEYEKAKFSTDTQTGNYNFKRYNIGINWLGQFPKTKLHLQLGGYTGYGFLTAEDWDNLKGIDLGILVGPAYESGHYGIALHLQRGYAWYESDGSPAGVMMYIPRYLLKIYYKL